MHMGVQIPESTLEIISWLLDLYSLFALCIYIWSFKSEDFNSGSFKVKLIYWFRTAGISKRKKMWREDTSEDCRLVHIFIHWCRVPLVWCWVWCSEAEEWVNYLRSVCIRCVWCSYFIILSAYHTSQFLWCADVNNHACQHQHSVTKPPTNLLKQAPIHVMTSYSISHPEQTVRPTTIPVEAGRADRLRYPPQTCRDTAAVLVSVKGDRMVHSALLLSKCVSLCKRTLQESQISPARMSHCCDCTVFVITKSS